MVELDDHRHAAPVCRDVYRRGFFLVFIGVAAMLSGILKLMMPSVPMWAEWLTFASLALVTMIFSGTGVPQTAT